MASFWDPLTPFNYHQWKNDMEIQFNSKGLYRITMDTDIEPNHVVDKVIYWNKLDEDFGFSCLSISKDLIFHIMGLKTPKKIWDQLYSPFDKQDDLRISHLENDLISLHPGNFEH